jgi:hypothetical protein
MEINKLKRLLAEGNPDKQLDNIIENLSEDSKIPFDRQIHRVDAKEGTEEQTAAKLKQLQMQASQYGKNIPPAVVQEIRKLEGLLKNREAQTNIARSFVKETIKDKNNNQKDALTGEKLKEGVEKMKLETIKFGNRVESTPELNKEMEKNKNNKEDSLMNKEQKAIFEQSMEDIFKILKEEDDEITEEEVMVGEVPAVESPEVELPVEEEVVEVMPGQEVVQAEEPVLEPELAANDAELAGAIPSEEVMEVQPEEEFSAPDEHEDEEAMAEVELEDGEFSAPDEHEDEEAMAEVELEDGEFSAPDEHEDEEAMAEAELEDEVMTQSDEEEVTVNPQETSVELQDNSVLIRIPLSSQSQLASEFSEEESEALQEALRVVYKVLGASSLSESEEVEIPEEAEAKLEVNPETKTLEIEIQLGSEPREEISQEEADTLQEAIAVISYLLKEEIEVSKTEEQQYRVEKEIAPSDAPEAVVKAEVKSGEIVIQPHDHADAEGKRIRDAILKEYEEMFPESSEESSEEVELETGDVESNVEVTGDTIKISIPLSSELNDLSDEASEGLQEAFKFIHSLISTQLLESDELLEASIIPSEGSVTFEIPTRAAKSELNESELASLQEMINFISFTLNEENLTENPGRTLTIANDTGGGVGTAAVAAAGSKGLIPAEWMAFISNIANSVGSSPVGQFAGKVGQGAAAATTGAMDLISKAAVSAGTSVGSFLTANPMLAMGIGASIPAIGAGAVAGLIGTKAGRKYLTKKFGIGKVGKKYKDIQLGREQGAKNVEKTENINKINARRTYLDTKAEGKERIKDAKRGLDVGTRVLSKIPLLNKLGNTNIFGFKPFQNIDVQDKIRSNKENLYSSLAGNRANELSSNKLKFDPTTGKLDFADDYGSLSVVDQQKARQKKDELEKELKGVGDFKTGVDAIVGDVKNQRELARRNEISARSAENQARLDSNIEIAKANAYKKDKYLNDLDFDVAKSEVVKENFLFDIDRAYGLLENLDLTEDQKLDVLAESYSILFYGDLTQQILESGYNISEKGLSLFLESKGIDLEQKQKGDVLESLNSESVKKNFEEHYQSKRHLDIKSDEITNKDMETGMKSEDVKPVIVESVDKPHSKEVNHSGSDTIDSDGGLTKDEEASEDKVEDIVKAEPKDVTEAVQYKSLKEAFLLENGYFEKDSVSVISPADKKSKLLNQLGLLVARDVQDPLYEELLKTTAHAKQLQEELQGKYKAVALKKAGQLLESKSKKSDDSQASSLEFTTALYKETLQEGFGE